MELYHYASCRLYTIAFLFFSKRCCFLWIVGRLRRWEIVGRWTAGDPPSLLPTSHPSHQTNESTQLSLPFPSYKAYKMLTTRTKLRTVTPALCYSQLLFPSKISVSAPIRARGLSTSHHHHHHPQHIPVIRTLAQLRRWRRTARQRGLEVGVVPTVSLLFNLFFFWETTSCVWVILGGERSA